MYQGFSLSLSLSSSELKVTEGSKVGVKGGPLRHEVKIHTRVPRKSTIPGLPKDEELCYYVVGRMFSKGGGNRTNEKEYGPSVLWSLLLGASRKWLSF